MSKKEREREWERKREKEREREREIERERERWRERERARKQERASKRDRHRAREKERERVVHTRHIRLYLSSSDCEGASDWGIECVYSVTKEIESTLHRKSGKGGCK